MNFIKYLLTFFEEEPGALSMSRLLSFALVAAGIGVALTSANEALTAQLIGYGLGAKLFSKYQETKVAS